METRQSVCPTCPFVYPSVTLCIVALPAVVGCWKL